MQWLRLLGKMSDWKNSHMLLLYIHRSQECLKWKKIFLQPEAPLYGNHSDIFYKSKINTNRVSWKHKWKMWAVYLISLLNGVGWVDFCASRNCNNSRSETLIQLESQHWLDYHLPWISGSTEDRTISSQLQTALWGIAKQKSCARTLILKFLGMKKNNWIAG